ncbi:hypothetical protein GCM10010112_08800 [Actinoplanes lobatus]|uniref:Uncharacterized protein n=1 Tax=Actinoplanes lobatus TaxID=113568 RepID=A0ABQ4A9S8_9ACTN|nr:hypothetical protein GCM10010112_08800 [Actinoplanes lobatus]GIE37752.1 hypothetical protein Alo02nite_06500 [Actinoplanes lobatus]
MTAGSSTPVAWRSLPQPPARRDRRDGREEHPGCLASTTATTHPGATGRHLRGYPTDLRPAGAAQAGAGSRHAPTGRNGPDETGTTSRVPERGRKRNERWYFTYAN